MLLVFSAIDKSQAAIVAACTNADAIKIYNNFSGAGDAGEPTVVTAFDAAITKIKAAFDHYGVSTILIVIGPG